MIAIRWFAKHPGGLYLPPSSWNMPLFVNADSSSFIVVRGTFGMVILPTKYEYDINRIEKFKSEIFLTK